jgi:hypothetical protein
VSEPAAQLASGTVLHHCPLCPWLHAQPARLIDGPPEPYDPDEAATRLMDLEKLIHEHLATHPLIEWVRETGRLLAESRRLRAELDAAIAQLEAGSGT